MKKILALILILSLPLCFACCSFNNDDKDNSSATEDKITIKSVVQEGEVTKVLVAYELVSSEEGELMVGCKEPGTVSDYIIIQDNIIMLKGKGEYLFTIETASVLTDEICADLSAYPHPSTWEPLATDYFFIDN